MGPVTFKKLSRLALDFFFPQWCLGCHREGEPICPSCRRNLPRLLPPLCARCGHPLPVEPCLFCRQLVTGLDGLRSPYRFEGLVREAIHRFKYQHLKALAPPLAELLAEYVKSQPLPGEVLVPVPLHPRRLRERGYNQAGLLVRGLSRLLGLPAAEGCLVRQHHSPAQARTTSADERWANVSDAFRCDGGVAGKAVLLIDDVCTTGATLGACAQALKAAGAVSVWGLTLAREV